MTAVIQSCAQRPVWALLLLIVVFVVPERAAWADNFGAVRYDARKDELVITMLYRGTNPNHDFSLTWGECKRPDGREPEIVANVLDTQALDAARRDYQKTIHVSLARLDCRPGNLTLRTAPHFYYSVHIPARAS